MSSPQLPDLASIGRDFANATAQALANMTESIAELNRTMPFAAAHIADALQPLGSANQHLKPLLRWAVFAAADIGMPETEIARRAGLDRMTVRSWLGKQLKRGDQVTGEPYGDGEPGSPFHQGIVSGIYVPRDDCRDARPPVDAAWIDDGSVDGPWMVKRETVKRVR